MSASAYHALQIGTAKGTFEELFAHVSHHQYSIDRQCKAGFNETTSPEQQVVYALDEILQCAFSFVNFCGFLFTSPHHVVSEASLGSQQDAGGSTISYPEKNCC